MTSGESGGDVGRPFIAILNRFSQRNCSVCHGIGRNTAQGHDGGLDEQEEVYDHAHRVPGESENEDFTDRLLAQLLSRVPDTEPEWLTGFETNLVPLRQDRRCFPALSISELRA